MTYAWAIYERILQYCYNDFNILMYIYLYFFSFMVVQFHVLVRNLTSRAYRPRASATLYRRRRVVVTTYACEDPACGGSRVAVPPTYRLNTFGPSPVYVNPYPYARTAFNMCGEYIFVNKRILYFILTIPNYTFPPTYLTTYLPTHV